MASLKGKSQENHNLGVPLKNYTPHIFGPEGQGLVGSGGQPKEGPDPFRATGQLVTSSQSESSPSLSGNHQTPEENAWLTRTMMKTNEESTLGIMKAPRLVFAQILLLLSERGDVCNGQTSLRRHGHKPLQRLSKIPRPCK